MFTLKKRARKDGCVHVLVRNGTIIMDPKGHMFHNSSKPQYGIMVSLTFLSFSGFLNIPAALKPKKIPDLNTTKIDHSSHLE